MDAFYNNISQSQSKMSNLLKSDKYDQSFSLTTLIQNLFNFDSDISNYEQPDTQSNHSTTTSQNDSNSNASSTSNDTSAPKQIQHLTERLKTSHHHNLKLSRNIIAIQPQM